jgi:hypothetical protein
VKQIEYVKEVNKIQVGKRRIFNNCIVIGKPNTGLQKITSTGIFKDAKSIAQAV